MILLVNQHTVPVFTDVVNAFAKDRVTRLITGYIQPGRAPISPSVRIIHSIAYNRSSAFSRFFSWTVFSTHYFFYLMFCKKPSHILVVSNPPTAPFITALVAGLRKIPFSIVVFDLYPEALQQAGMSSDKNWLFKRWQSNNRWTFKRAKSIITLSESMKAAVMKYVDALKVHIIFNWADTDYIKPVDRKQNLFAAKHQLNNKFVVLYSGNMGLTHDLESLIEAAHILEAEKNIFFLLIGEGGKRKKLEAVVTQKKLENVRFLPYQDAASFPLAMASADVGVVTLGTGAEGISVPSKTYVNMAAGLAIIAISPANSELNRIVEQFSLGYVVLPNQPARLAEHIRFLANNPEELSKLKSRSREASLNFTSANADKYVEHLNRQS
jgi:glycosyltransferase involved in cell wall biosynthesis